MHFAPTLVDYFCFPPTTLLRGTVRPEGPEQLLHTLHKSTASWLDSWLLGCLFADWDPQQMEDTSLSPAWDPGLTDIEIVKRVGNLVVEQFLRHKKVESSLCFWWFLGFS